MYVILINIILSQYIHVTRKHMIFTYIGITSRAMCRCMHICIRVYIHMN